MCYSACPSGCTGTGPFCACPPEKCGAILAEKADAHCEVAAKCDDPSKPKSCEIKIDSCEKTKYCSEKKCEWYKFWEDCWLETVACGVETVTECGVEIVSSGAECGYEATVDAARCGADVVVGAAECTGALVEGLLQCTFPREVWVGPFGVFPENCGLRDSFDERDPSPKGLDGTFTIAALGDPQFGFPGKPGAPLSHDRVANVALVQAINQVRSNAPHFQGLTLLGDWTHQIFSQEFKDFSDVWGPSKNNGEDQNWKHRVWPILGNHDYKNYVNDKWYTDQMDGIQNTYFQSFGDDGASQFMTSSMRSIVGGCKEGNGFTSMWKTFGGADHYDFNSMGYAWEVGQHRFVAGDRKSVV